jgi:short-subunit dehydrogenase
MKQNDSKHLVWLITGTSQGFGKELVRAALQRGDSVIATSRTPEKVTAEFPEAADRLKVISLDLRDDKQVKVAIDKAVTYFGRIDVLVNNAGHGLLGAVEEANDDEISNIFDINVFGLNRVTRALLPYFRKQRKGHIVNISSIAGLVGIPGWGIYNSTKFAVEGLSEALAQEVAPLGIKVTIVEPGPFRTDFLGSSLTTTQKRFPEYEQTAGKTRTDAEKRDGKQQGDPVLGVEAIIQAITSENPPLRLLLGELAYEKANEKLKQLQTEFKEWKEVSLATDYKS